MKTKFSLRSFLQTANCLPIIFGMPTALFLLLALSSAPLALCQIPQGFNYQAIAKDGSGNPIASQSLPVRISIQSDSLGGTVYWVELHSGVTTNNQGLFTLVVGKGVKQSGTAATFSAIDWSVTPKYIMTEVDYSGWKTLGSSKLWSVPYAMRTMESEQWQTSGSNLYRMTGNIGIGISNPTSKVAVQPSPSWDDNIPLFEVKNKLGIPVLAVYNNGVRILVDHTIAKSPKGGFAVSGYDFSKAGKTVDLMTVSPDSIRFNINNDNGKAVKGGFAVGGFDVNSKGPINQDFMYITPQTSNNGQYNTFLGYQAGYNNQNTGLYNSFIGYQAGFTNSTGSQNAFMGYNAGLANISGTSNVFLGPKAGFKNTIGSSNVFIGIEAGRENTEGERGVKIGIRAGLLHKTGEGNVSIGYEAGSGYDGSNDATGIVTGQGNTMIGTYSGKTNLTGSNNTIIGFQSGIHFRNGSRNTYVGTWIQRENVFSSQPDDNVYIGYGVANNNQEGDNNVMVGTGAGGASGTSSETSGSVFIGYNAGHNETASNRLYIANSSTTTPLIGGSFSPTPMVGINRMPTAHTLEVGGDIWANGSSISAGAETWSDARYKTDIVPLAGALQDVLNLQGVKFNWKETDFPDLNFPEGEQVGVLAQEVEKVLPQLVRTNPDGYKSVSYEKFTPVLIEAIKEQQQQIEMLMKMIGEMKEQIASLSRY